ncbi:polysaccharide deacetylase family protein [Skermanella rosea]|uniref:polysaccharide deacetylase family protein n=1 Tax=Skermanella rosea TaxID=1817965 RepID=UPI001E574660|nr:polysaccharide deacetylase family protein [Skermanella rosea]UEM03830.1 polysaccharide deacetylase family protein [Skermanella rosea]
MALKLFHMATPVRRFAAALLWLTLLGGGRAHGEVPVSGPPDQGAGAVVFAYGRFGEDQYGPAGIGLDQFDQHLAELSDGAYTVMPLPAILDRLRRGAPLPDRTVALTIDDAHRSVYREAFPRLKQAALPFTLFVAPDPIDAGSQSHMTWAQVREVARAGAVIGVLPAAGLSMPQRTVQQNAADLARAVERVEAELGVRPTLLAYPFGSYSLAVRDLARRQGFDAAFSQSSGVAHARSDALALPRFFMNDSFGGIDRFRLAANALPLAVADVTPADPMLRSPPALNPPSVGFTVTGELRDLDRLACFVSGQGRAALERLDGNRIELRIAEEMPPGRTRLNCTLPAADGRWRWFGMQFLVPDP